MEARKTFSTELSKMYLDLRTASDKIMPWGSSEKDDIKMDINILLSSPEIAMAYTNCQASEMCYYCSNGGNNPPMPI